MRNSKVLRRISKNDNARFSRHFFAISRIFCPCLTHRDWKLLPLFRNDSNGSWRKIFPPGPLLDPRESNLVKLCRWIAFSSPIFTPPLFFSSPFNSHFSTVFSFFFFFPTNFITLFPSLSLSLTFFFSISSVSPGLNCIIFRPPLPSPPPFSFHSRRKN